MPDNMLKIGAEFDVAPIVEGTKQAIASFDEMGAKSIAGAAQVKTAFESAAAASSATVGQVQSATAETLEGFLKTKAGGILAFDALRAKVIETTAEVGRLRAEILQTDDQAKLTKLREQLAEATQQMTAARTEMRALRMESQETREKLDLMGETVGIKIPGAFGNLLGKIPLVQSAMAAAFSISIVAFFIGMIGEAIEKIGEMSEEIGGFGKAAKQAYEEALNYNQKMIERNLELQEKLEKVSTIGIEGSAKFGKEQELANESTKRWAAELGNANKELSQTRDEIRELETKKTWIYGPFAGLVGVNSQLEESQSRLKRLQEEVDTVESKLRNRPVESKTAGAEETARSREEALHDEAAATDARKKLTESYTEFRLASAKRERELSTITLDEEVAAEITAVEEKIAAERRFAAERLATLSKQAATGRDVTPEIISTREKLEAEELKSQQSLADIRARAQKERETQDLANATAEINSAHTIAEAQIKLEEDRARRTFTKADTPAELEATAIPVIRETNAQYDDQIAKLRERASLLASTVKIPDLKVSADLGTAEFEKQIQALKQASPEIYRQLLELNTEEKRIRSEQSDAVERIELQKTEKIKAIRAKEVEDQVKSVSDELILEEGQYRSNISFIQELYTEKKLSLSEYTSTAKLFANEEYSNRIQTLEKEREIFKAARDADILTEEQYTRKIEELATQQTKFREQKEQEVTRFTKEEAAKREAALRQATERVADEFVSSVNRMISHEQTFRQSMVQLAQQLELNLIDQGIKRVTVHYGEEFAKMAADHLGFITKFIADHSTFLATLLGIEVTHKTTTTAAQVAADKVEVTGDAGKSFAAGFASVMEALPFPVNVATAPGVAAAAASATLAGGIVFEKGGIMPEGHHVAFVRPQEAVLPVGLTNSLQGAVPSINNFNNLVKNGGGIQPAGSSSGNAGDSYKTMHNHIRVEVHNNGGEISDDKIIAAVHRGIRSGSARLFS